MCADSMFTHTIPTPTGNIVTNFEHAEKLVPLGKDMPAAAMLNGNAVLIDEFVSVTIKRAGAHLERTGKAGTKEIIDSVKAAVNSLYNAKLAILKPLWAQQWSTPEALAKVNPDRRSRGLPDVTVVTPDRVAVVGDPANSTDPTAYDVFYPYGLTVIVASYFGDAPAATELIWPGCRQNDILATFGKTLVWWGSGSVPVSRLMRGVDLDRLRESAKTDADAQAADNFFQREAVSFSMPVPMSAMPLQDAIDFAEFMGETACGYDRFRAGPPTVGGELDTLVLTPGNWEWVEHKVYHSRRKRQGGSR